MVRTESLRQSRKNKKPARKKLLTKTAHKAGRPPGTLIHVGETPASAVSSRGMNFDHMPEPHWR